MGERRIEGIGATREAPTLRKSSLLKRLRKEKDWRLFVAPDHLTPLAIKTHLDHPVPFIFAGSDVEQASGKPYTEKDAAETGVYLDQGHDLMRRLIKGWGV